MPNATPRTMVYVASASANELAVLRLTDGGVLEPVQQFPIPAGVTPLAIHPTCRFLYAGLRSDPPAVLALAIDPTTGRLELSTRAALMDPPMYLATDARGNFLFSASYADATFTVKPIEVNGDVGAQTVVHRATPPQAHGIATDRANRSVFVTALGADAILQYQFDAATGNVEPNAVSSVSAIPGSGPRHLVFHPRLDVLYVNGELDGSVSSYTLDPSTGRLAALNADSVFAAHTAAKPWGAELGVTPDGRFLYASERRTSILTSFAVDATTGAIERRAVFPAETQPRAFAIDPHGRFLIVAGEASNYLCSYAIDSRTGDLQTVERYPIGEKPVWVSVITLPAGAPADR